MPASLHYKPEMAYFPKRLRELMDRSGLNQVELERRSSVDQSTISKYLRGTVEPTLESLMALARALRCSLEDLTGLEALHEVEAKLPAVSDKAMKLAQFIEALDDSDPLKKYLLELIRAKSESHDTGASGGETIK